MSKHIERLRSEMHSQDVKEMSLPPLSVRTQLAGRHILITGVTGFVGKVLLTMIASYIPKVRRLSILIRKNKHYSNARERFEHEVLTSEPFKAIRKKIGEKSLKSWVDDHIYPITGDITLERLGISEENYLELTQNDPLDLILHCAGNVNFDPPLNEALEVNTLGVAHKLELARDAGCPLVHMSTCFVTGERSGLILEDPEIIGYTPKGVLFDVEREVEEAVTAIQRWRTEAETQVMSEQFRQDAIKELNDRGIDPEGEFHLASEIKRQRRKWLNHHLQREGMDRAKRWGWTNTYTYTKSMGEQLTLSRARREGVKVTIVRPAIVESAFSFPFPGWNEGINTCAPIVYLYWKGQRFTPSNPDNILDIIPVDWVCRGTLLAASELLEGERAKTVYQFCTGEANPLRMRRAIELTNLAWRPRYDRDFSFFERHLLRNLDTLVVHPDFYKKAGAPAVQTMTRRAQGLLKNLPKSARTLFSPISKGLKSLEKAAGIADTIFQIFAPFILENNPEFSARNTQEAASRLVNDERDLFDFNPSVIDWRHYWKDVHMEGLQKWVFGQLDEKLTKKQFKPRERDLVALFHRTCDEYKHQRALQLFTEDGVKVTYTYDDLWRGALTIAGALRTQGVQKEDNVLLMSPNEPAWPMAYIGILLADATVVPLDHEMNADEVGRVVRKSKAKMILHHEDYPQTLEALSCTSEVLSTPPIIITLGEAFQATPINVEEISLHDRAQEVASLLFTSGTTGDPKGVMLTHENFCSLLSSLHGVFKVSHRDRFLSVLPLFHTFEFSGGFLMPISVGAQITYLSDLEGSILRSAMKKVRPTGIIGIPALWDVLQKRIESQVKDRGEAARLAFKWSVKLNRSLRQYGINIGPNLFSEVHKNLGGKVRYLISGGASLNENTLEIFEGLGFELLEGYGLTEAGPVLAVRRPKSKSGAGSVGRPLPGVNIKINNPDESGVGEVIAKADNVMIGYLDQPEKTAQVIRDGWLHTGDLGMIDKKGNLVLSGRSKEMIVTSSGKNVYPDEMEPIFADHEYIKEIAIVGIPDPQGDERVAGLIVIDEDAPKDAQRDVKAHITTINALRPDHQRLRTFRFWPKDLPRTATRKVKRNEVRSELIRLLEVGKAVRRAEFTSTQYKPAWLYASLAGLCNLEITDLSPTSHLITDLGLSSLQLVELRLMIEEHTQKTIAGDLITKAEHISDLLKIVNESPINESTETTGSLSSSTSKEEALPLWRDVPDPLRDTGKRVIDFGRNLAYKTLYNIKVKGEENIPHNEQVIVISNHSSHLDIGLIKEALGSCGDDLCVLAAQDYFFDDQYKEAIFGQFTQLIPIDRAAPLDRSFRPAEDAIQQGYSVLMYPEGTRSMNGELQEFKAGIGYLQQRTGLPILPLYIRGTHKAFPKGKAFPKVGRTLSVRIGRLIQADRCNTQAEGKRRHEVYQAITNMCREAIEALRDGVPYSWEKTAEDREVHSAGPRVLFEYLEERFDTERVDQSITWYFSLGDGADTKWTLSVDSDTIQFHQGRPKQGQADCVLKTDIRIFERMVREGYVPSFAEFAEGKVKTNNPNHLRAFQSIFAL